MLTHLSVRDLAIVEAVEIELGPGLTVVSGETGAGKSLLVDALLLVSGARADSGAVRAGCARADISAGFDLAGLPDVVAWLRERELDDGTECLLRRVVRSEGASRAWINGRAVSAQALAEVAALLVEIHGQHEHQALMDRAAQLRLLDAHGALARDLAAVSAAAARWHELDRQRRQLEAASGDDGGRLARLEHELAELKAHALSPADWATLERQHHRLAHQGATLEACAEAAARLDGDGHDNALAALARARQALARAQGGDATLTPLVERLGALEIELRDAAQQLAGYFDEAETDPERLQALDRQLSRLHELGRRHRLPPSELANRRDALAEEVADLSGASERLQALAGELARAESDWRRAADALSARRADVARRLSADVVALLGELGMPGSRFEIALLPNDAATPDRQGQERVEFQVSANPGQPLRPLRKVASGGELSRIALAIEVAALGHDPVPTMVFDEVDAGVGGAVAEILGQKLRRLGSRVQALCVTHLPQVAAQGHQHLVVSKGVVGDAMRTQVTAVDGDARVGEVARMLGGVEITKTTLAHAAQMLAHASEGMATVPARRRSRR